MELLEKLRTRRRAASLAGVSATLAATMAAALCALPSDAAAARPQKRQGILVALIVPFQGQTERGMLRVQVRPRSSRVRASLTGLVADPSDPTGSTYALRLSRRSCGSLRRTASGHGFIGPDLLGFADFDPDRETAYLEQDNVYNLRDLRRVRSVALTVDLGRGDDKFQVQACGRVIASADVIVSTRSEGRP